MNEQSAMIDKVIDIALRAGLEILKIYAEDFSVEKKADNSPLTRADLASHHLITTELAKLDVAIPILSEESGEMPYAERRRWRRYWLVDPLDGTKEFINKNGEFTVNIALIEDHEPVLGVVHVPALDVTYAGSRDAGAFRQESDGRRTAIGVRAPAGDPVVAVASRSHRTPEVDRFLERLGEHRLTSIGSSLKICLVAEGKADIYPRLGPTSEWDTAAAHGVLLAAGGKITDDRGHPLRYNTKESLLNPHFLAFGDCRRDWVALVPGQAG